MDGEQGREVMPYAHLEELLKQNLEMATENHKILRRMERNALIGLIVRTILWLLVLGVPIFLLSTYLAPVIQQLQESSSAHPGGLFGLPSADELQKAIQEYKAPQGK